MNGLIDIVTMEAAHLQAVYDIEQKSFYSPWSLDALEKELNENTFALYWVALHGERVVGYAGMWHIVNEGHITNIAVDPDFRRRGVGQALIDKMIVSAREKEMIGITLECRIGNLAAQRLYTKNGFKPEGIRKDYYTDTHEDAVIMWKMMYDATSGDSCD